MENAVEALKIAFAVMMFVMALSLSVFSLSRANAAVTAIINMRDRENEYTYVKPSNGFTRTVGVEDIVPTLYRAYLTNFDVYFFDKNGNPLKIYRTKDVNGVEIDTNYIDGSEVFANAEVAMDHLNQVLEDSLYNELSGKKFTEDLGEYYQNDSENTPDANKITKRVITYTEI